MCIRDSVDVAPTILELAGIAPWREMRGTSLADSVLTGREPELRPAFAEAPHDPSPDRFAVILGALKVIYAPEPAPSGKIGSSALEVFDLDLDPGERTPLAVDERALALKELIRERLGLRQQGAQTKEEFSPEILEQLKALGYVH